VGTSLISFPPTVFLSGMGNMFFVAAHFVLLAFSSPYSTLRRSFVFLRAQTFPKAVKNRTNSFPKRDPFFPKRSHGFLVVSNFSENFVLKKRSHGFPKRDPIFQNEGFASFLNGGVSITLSGGLNPVASLTNAYFLTKNGREIREECASVNLPPLPLCSPGRREIFFKWGMDS